jgi:hypothetical protein
MAFCPQPVIESHSHGGGGSGVVEGREYLGATRVASAVSVQMSPADSAIAYPEASPEPPEPSPGVS